MPDQALVDVSPELRARDGLLRRATHDLRTPLGALLTWVKVLRADPSGPQSGSAVEMTERAARQLCSIVSAIEDAQLLMTGTLELRRESIDLVAAVGSALDSARAMATSRKLTVELAPAGASILVEADAERVGRVLERLIADVIVLTPSAGRVQIEVDSSGRSGRVQLRCTGLVLAAPLRQALEGGPEWPALAGPGGQVALDFAMALRLIELHGGALRTTEGSSELTIELRLPLARTQDAARA
jgi:signal transduction histidine kinase